MAAMRMLCKDPDLPEGEVDLTRKLATYIHKAEDAAATPVVDGGENHIGELLLPLVVDPELEQLRAGAVRPHLDAQPAGEIIVPRPHRELQPCAEDFGCDRDVHRQHKPTRVQCPMDLLRSPP